MKKTIKELADELGVSKDRVKYQVRKLPSELTSKKNGVIYLSNAAVERVTVELVGNNTQVVTSEINHSLPTDFIKEELDKKDNELNEKNKQIEELHSLLKQQQKLLDQQQVLTLQANKKIAELETTLNVEEETVIPKESSDDIKKEDNEPDKKSFFARLFGR